MSLRKVDLSQLSSLDRESTTLYGMFRAPTLRRPVSVGRFPDHLAKRAAKELPARDWVVRNMLTGRIVRRATKRPHIRLRFGQWAVWNDLLDSEWPFPVVATSNLAALAEVWEHHYLEGGHK